MVMVMVLVMAMVCAEGQCRRQASLTPVTEALPLQILWNLMQRPGRGEAPPEEYSPEENSQ